VEDANKISSSFQLFDDSSKNQLTEDDDPKDESME
jgi:hypothetical protein